MEPIRATVADDLIDLPRDERWQREVAHEKLISVILAERHARWTNVLLWCVMLIAAMTLPDPDYVLAALGIRVIAMLCAHPALARLRRCLESGRDPSRAVTLGALSLALGGASWALLLGSVYVEPVVHFVRAVIAGGSFIALALIYSLLTPAPRLANAFIGGFAVTMLATVSMMTEVSTLYALLAVASLLSIIVSYGWGISKREARAAEMLVENRMLGEELADSLAHAEFLAYRDPLTGLRNRRSFFEEIEAGQNDRVRQIVTIDLDHFKSINDRFGHPVGDKVLVAVGQILRDIARELPGEGNCAVRMGGEEFLLLIDSDDAKFIALICERIRHGVRSIAAELEIDGLETSTSIGIALWTPDTPVDEVISHADDALYRAKERGRNQIASAAA